MEKGRVSGRVKKEIQEGKRLVFHKETKLVIQYSIAMLLTLFCGALLVLLQGERPVYALKEIFYGAFGNEVNIGTSLRWMTPSLLVGAAGVISFRSGVMNMGMEGQMYLGALSSAILGYSLHLPMFCHIFLCLLIGGVTGALYALIPGLIRLYFHIHELITTLLLNFLAALFTEYIVMWVILGGKQAENGSQSIATPEIVKTAVLQPIIKDTMASTGFFLAIFLVLLLWALFRFTIFGYELNQMGRNTAFARQGGVAIEKNYLAVLMLSGGIAGLCGAIEVMGSYHRFIPYFSKNMSWDGIMITRIAMNNPLAVFPVSFIWGALKAGALNMERVTKLNRLVVNLIQMFFVLFIAVDYASIWRTLKRKFSGKMGNDAGEMKL